MTGSSFRLSVLVVALTLYGAVQHSNAGEAGPSQPCVEVTVGKERAGSLDCLNEQLRQAVQHQQPIVPVTPYGVNSPPTQLGLFNESAERERLGDAFGHSVQPQRPAH